MTEPSLALQAAIRARLVAASAVTSLVPAASILDRNARPAPFPSIIIGEGQTVPDEGLVRAERPGKDRGEGPCRR